MILIPESIKRAKPQSIINQGDLKKIACLFLFQNIINIIIAYEKKFKTPITFDDY